MENYVLNVLMKMFTNLIFDKNWLIIIHESIFIPSGI
jgi:predicted metallopeptidase